MNWWLAQVALCICTLAKRKWVLRWMDGWILRHIQTFLFQYQWHMMTWRSKNYKKWVKHFTPNWLWQLSNNEHKVTRLTFFAKCQWHAVHWKLIGISLRLPFLQSEEEYQCAAAERNGKRKKGLLGKYYKCSWQQLAGCRCHAAGNSKVKRRKTKVNKFPPSSLSQGWNDGC